MTKRQLRKLRNKLLSEDELMVLFNIKSLHSLDSIVSSFYIEVKIPNLIIEGKRYFFKKDILKYIEIKQNLYKKRREKNEKRRLKKQSNIN